MQAYKCDYCGTLFVVPTTITARCQPSNETLNSVLVRADNGERVDICEGCRYRMEKALGEHIEEVRREWQEEWEKDLPKLMSVLFG